MDTYLVTGGAGFIGSHIADELVRRGESVRVLDNLSTGKRENLAGVNEQIEFREGDIRNLEIVRCAMQGVDYVLHQAALPSVPRSIADPMASHEVNVTGTLNVLIAARDAQVKRVVFASSSSVYGDNPTLPKVETMSPRPRSPYAVSKLSAEQYCQVFTQVYGLETVSLRYFNVFGSRQDPYSHYSAVIPKFIIAALNDEAIGINSDGLQSRDFTYVSNVVNANLRACKAASVAGQVMNVSCGERYTLLDLIMELESLLGKSIGRLHGPERVGDVKHSQADIGQACQLLEYVPLVKFNEGLARTVDWYRNFIVNSNA